MTSENIIMAMVKAGANRQVSSAPLTVCFILIKAHSIRNVMKRYEYYPKKQQHK